MESTSSVQYHLCDKKNCFFCQELTRLEMLKCPPQEELKYIKAKTAILMKLINVQPVTETAGI
jgi:hypothetical protein